MLDTLFHQFWSQASTLHLLKHTYAGDLYIELISPSGQSVLLQAYEGIGEQNVIKTFNVNAAGIERNGEWKLRVTDSVIFDYGYIDSWTINF